MFFAKIKTWRTKRRWEKMSRNERTVWTHRYFRLHPELLDDPVYKTVYDRNRARLIARLQQRMQDRMDHEEVGKVVDLTADSYNKFAADRVNAYKPIMEEMYLIWELMTCKREENTDGNKHCEN